MPKIGNGILFVSHEATRTGAPTNLLHFLRWFKKNGDRPFSILLGSGGELAPEFENLADTWSLDSSKWGPHGLRTGLLIAAGLGKWARKAEERNTQQFAANCRPALVYANSIGSARTVAVLAPSVPVLTHVHEMGYAFTAKNGDLSRLLAGAQRFIACSRAVRDRLMTEQSVPASTIETVYESIPVGEVRPERTREEILHELDIPAGSSIVVASGYLGWVKGSDIFVQLARTLCQQRPDLYFVWVGSGSPWDVAQFKYDAQMFGVEAKTRFAGPVANLADYLGASDVFVLTSRVDSFPLVCLEAAACGKPILCFEGAGGAPEFVENDCGFVVPYLDVVAMAQRVACLLDSPQCCNMMGEAARRKVMQRHDISVAAPQIMRTIERTIAGG